MFRFLKRSETPGGVDPAHAALLRILELNKEMARATRPELLLERILDAAIELAGAERGFLIQRAGAERAGTAALEPGWEVVAARNIDRENVRKALQKVSQTITQRVFETGQAFRSDDALGDNSLAPSGSVAELKLRSVLCVPLRAGLAGEGVRGCLYVDNRFAQGQFSAETQELLEAFSDQASLALEHARLLEENQRARESAERANVELEQRLREKQQALENLSASPSAPAQPLRFGYRGLVGTSPAMHAMLSVLDRITDGDFPVLLVGESGTGKELVARALHKHSPRSTAPFLAVNCGAIAEGLLESELFGAVKGAYTGAVRDRAGLFEAAHGGVLFLDEIGEMSLSLQAKLLRVLQERSVRRVGGNEELPVDVRVLSATNRDLAGEVAEGRFREDLYYRLKVVQVEVPPLRERRADIPLLVEYFLERLVAEGVGPRPRPEISQECMDRLMSHGWPGNVRELQNEVTRMYALGGQRWGPELLNHLSSAPRLGGGSGMRSLVGRKMHDVEAELIRSTLEAVGGKRGEAARMLGIPRRTFYNRLKALGIE